MRYITRDEWGARASRRGYSAHPRTHRAVVHHTADANSEPAPNRPGPKWFGQVRKGIASLRVRRAIAAYQRQDARYLDKVKAAMRSMQAFHQNGRGWNDIGYTAVGWPDGTVCEGRPFGVYGAHAVNGNHMPGYSFAGNFEKERPTARALAAFHEWCAEKGIRDLVGHYKVPGNATACPGIHLKTALGL